MKATTIIISDPGDEQESIKSPEIVLYFSPITTEGGRPKAEKMELVSEGKDYYNIRPVDGQGSVACHKNFIFRN